MTNWDAPLANPTAWSVIWYALVFSLLFAVITNRNRWDRWAGSAGRRV